MTIEKAELIAAIDCCMLEDGCDLCPMLKECCDVPFIPFTEVPVELLTQIRKELAKEFQGKVQ